MIVEFRFNSKSSGQNVPEAIRIAERCGGFIEDKFYKIKFNDPESSDLKKLFELVGNLKGTAIVIDNEEPVIAHKFFNAVSCPEKFLCKGTCLHVKLGYYNILDFPEIHSENIENNIFSTSEHALITRFTEFLEEIEGNRFKFDKEMFLEYFKRETEMENKFCKKYNISKIEKSVEKLPDEIKLVPYEESPEYKEEELEIENITRTILSNCEISSKLSISEVIECSKTITYLMRADAITSLENTELLISSFPESRKIILAKLRFDEEFEQDEELEDEEIKYIVTKKHEFFCASNPFSILYFRLLDEQDPKLEEYFAKLKNLK